MELSLRVKGEGWCAEVEEGGAGCKLEGGLTLVDWEVEGGIGVLV